MKIGCVICCNSYWNRYRYTAQSLRRASQGLGEDIKIVTVTTDDVSIPSIVRLEAGDKPHRKAAMISAGIEAIFNDAYVDAIALLDADVIYPSTFFRRIRSELELAGQKTCFVGSSRQYLSSVDTRAIMDDIELPGEGVLIGLDAAPDKDGRDSKFMGWMQVFSTELLYALPLAEWSEFDGYDKFDYAAAQALTNAADTIVEIKDWLPSHYPLHLDHGHWGQNWRGTLDHY